MVDLGGHGDRGAIHSLSDRRDPEMEELMEIYKPEGSVVQRRPAETWTPVAAALALILGEVLGFRDDADLVSAVTVIVSFVPALVTFFASRAAL